LRADYNDKWWTYCSYVEELFSLSMALLANQEEFPPKFSLFWRAASLDQFQSSLASRGV
jgi:hypothetical protein